MSNDSASWDAWTDAMSPDEIRDMMRNTFRFLVTEYGFKEPKDRSFHQAVILSYGGRRIAIEPQVDERHPFIETGIARLTEGVRPESSKFDNRGEEYQARLFVLAGERGLSVALGDPPTSPRETLQLQLDYEVNLLLMGFQDFLKDDDRYFTELNQWRYSEIGIQERVRYFAEADLLFRTQQFDSLIQRLCNPRFALDDLWTERLRSALRLRGTRTK